MSQWNKLLISLFVGLLVVVLILLVMILNFDTGACKNTIHQAYLAPDSQLKAVVFERSCGEGNRISTQVSIVKGGQSIENNAGNILILDGSAFQVAPKLHWNLANELFIYHRLTGSEYRAETAWNEVKEVRIKYIAKKPGSI